MALEKEDILQALKEVYDPEIPVDIVNLGLVYEIRVEKGRIHVKITTTAPGCPVANLISAQIKKLIRDLTEVDLALHGEPIPEIGVDTVYDPPWDVHRLARRAGRCWGGHRLFFVEAFSNSPGGRSMESQMITLEHEHHRFDKATEVLKHEHRVIERVLAVIQKLTDASSHLSIEQWRKAIEFIRGFADQCHHLKEEKLLFPALEKHGIPLEGGPIGMMLQEHEEGRGYVSAMVEALAHAEEDPKASKKALAENAQAYLCLLREHILKEDEVLFNMADGTLSPDEQKQLVRQFEEHEQSEIGSGVHEYYLGIARELEKESKPCRTAPGSKEK